jgi:hypothetical protein
MLCSERRINNESFHNSLLILLSVPNFVFPSFLSLPFYFSFCDSRICFFSFSSFSSCINLKKFYDWPSLPNRGDPTRANCPQATRSPLWEAPTLQASSKSSCQGVQLTGRQSFLSSKCIQILMNPHNSIISDMIPSIHFCLCLLFVIVALLFTSHCVYIFASRNGPVLDDNRIWRLTQPCRIRLHLHMESYTNYVLGDSLASLTAHPVPLHPLQSPAVHYRLGVRTAYCMLPAHVCLPRLSSFLSHTPTPIH